MAFIIEYPDSYMWHFEIRHLFHFFRSTSFPRVAVMAQSDARARYPTKIELEIILDLRSVKIKKASDDEHSYLWWPSVLSASIFQCVVLKISTFAALRLPWVKYEFERGFEFFGINFIYTKWWPSIYSTTLL